MRLREEILDDAQRTVWDGLEGTRPPNSTVLSRLDRALKELEQVIARTHAQRRLRSRGTRRHLAGDPLALVAEDTATD